MSVDSVESEKNYLLCSLLKFILLILKNNIHFYKYSITFNEKQASYLLLTQNNYEIFSYNSIDVKHYWELDTIRKWFIKICSYYVPMYCLHTKEYIQPISHKIKRPLINFAYNIHVCLPHGKKKFDAHICRLWKTDHLQTMYPMTTKACQNFADRFKQ